MERTCCAHVEDADLSKIGAGLQSGQNGSPVVGHHLKSSAIDNVHFFAHFAWKTRNRSISFSGVKSFLYGAATSQKRAHRFRAKRSEIDQRCWAAPVIFCGSHSLSNDNRERNTFSTDVIAGWEEDGP